MARNNALNKQSLDEFTVTTDTSGATATSTVSNTSNTAGSDAVHIVSVAGASADDPTRSLSVTGITQYDEYIDNSDTDSLKLDLNGTGTFRKFFKTGERLLPFQPILKATFAGSRPNETGDGTGVTPINYTTVDFDVGSNFTNATGIFTAPVTAKYRASKSVLVTNVAGTHTTFQANFSVNAAPGASQFACGAGNTRTGANTIQFEGSETFDLTAGDTVTFGFLVSGSTKTVGYNFAQFEVWLLM